MTTKEVKKKAIEVLKSKEVRIGSISALSLLLLIAAGLLTIEVIKIAKYDVA